MTQPDFRARLSTLIAEHVGLSDDPLEVSDELLSEAIAANTVVGTRSGTAALLRRLADELDGPHG